MLNVFLTRFLIVISFAFGTSPLFATSIIPYAHLGEGIRLSETVVLAQALGVRERNSSGSLYADMEFRVITPLKGSLPAMQTFMVRPYSCAMADGGHWSVTGDFAPEAGHIYLLFLSRQEDFYRPNMLSYYVFEQKERQGEEILFPVAGTQDFATYARPDGIVPEALRSYSKQALLGLLRDYADNSSQRWRGDEAALKYRFQPVQDRALPSGCVLISGGTLVRWQNPDITIKYDQNYTYATSGVDVNTLLSSHVIPGFNASYTGLNPTNGGTITGTSTPYAGCPLNTHPTVSLQSIWLLIEDPCNSISDLSGCSGTLGIGGPVWYTPGHTYKGETWSTIRRGKVEVNNGVNCLGSVDNLKSLYQHEITHVFGMGHLTPNTENMYAFCCRQINSLDMTCVNYMYDAAAPVEIVRFDVRAQGNRVAVLSWESSTELNNRHYTIERSTDGIDFEPIAKVSAKGPGQYEWTDKNALAGLNYYRLSQTDAEGSTAQIGIRSIRFTGRDVEIAFWPNPVRDAAQCVITAEIPVEGILTLTAPDGRHVLEQQVSMEAGRWQITLPTGHLSAGRYQATLATATGIYGQTLVRQ